MSDLELLLSGEVTDRSLWRLIHSPETRLKLSQTPKNYKNGINPNLKFRAVVTPLGEFASVRLAGEAHGIQNQIVRKIIQKGARGWYYKDTPGTDVNAPHIQNRRAVKTPLGLFKSRGAAARAHDCDVCVIHRKCIQGVPGYEYV
jgi:hypothetical protein